MLSHHNPLGYRSLRTWQQAVELFELTEKFVATLPLRHPKTNQYLTDLIDQMIRSARSVVRNIEEGYTRTTTKEYISFLGFSAGSLEELIGDFKYCQKAGIDKLRLSRNFPKENIGESEGCSKGIQMGVGEAKMLNSQIRSLEEKMYKEKTTSVNDMARKSLNEHRNKEKDFDKWLKNYLKK